MNTTKWDYSIPHSTFQKGWAYIVRHSKLNWTFLSPFHTISKWLKMPGKSRNNNIGKKIRGKSTQGWSHTTGIDCRVGGGTNGRCRNQQERWGLEKDVLSGMCNNFYWTALWMNEHMIIIHKRPVNTSNNWNIESSIVGRTEQLHGAHIRVYTYVYVLLCVSFQGSPYSHNTCAMRKHWCLEIYTMKSIIDSI